MSENTGRASHERAIDVVRGYAHHDGIAVREALAGLEADGWTEVHVVLNGLLHSTLGIMELTGAQGKLGQLVRYADEAAAAAPLHYEFALGEATRAWALGATSALRTFAGRDVPETVHMTGVLIAAPGLALWGKPGFLDVVERLQESVTALLVNDRPSGTPHRRP
ncbi:hypothetical protein ACFYXS_04795 [Streptomyces sp. NPDC002574]|uniref:hypothetical protein n=1 Tax=Streptomyces sp. NPDC002574 TaxID=3364652 RepID=UPI0036AE8EB9